LHRLTPEDHHEIETEGNEEMAPMNEYQDANTDKLARYYFLEEFLNELFGPEKKKDKKE
jgi:hypothetical protein